MTTETYDPNAPSPPAQPIAGIPPLSDDQIKALLRYHTDAGKARKRTQGVDMSEADYIAGGMAFLSALGRWDKMPAMWVFGPLSGRPVYSEDATADEIAPEPSPPVQAIADLLDTLGALNAGLHRLQRHLDSIQEDRGDPATILAGVDQLQEDLDTIRHHALDYAEKDEA